MHPGRWSRGAVAAAVAAGVLVSGCGGDDGAAGPKHHPAPAPAPAPASAGASRPVPAGALQAIAEQYRNTCRAPGAAIGLRTRDGHEQYAIAGALAPGIALTRDSQFLAGSVTKLFVATVAYQLIAGHRLSLDDTVDHFLRDWPRGDRITVKMLLGHRSGMGDFGNDFSAQLRDLVLADPSRDFRYAEVLDLVKAVTPVAPPGAAYHYSNANYIVLGAILQDLTHRSLGELIQTHVLDPLALRHTIYGPDRLAAAAAITFHGLFDITGAGQPVDIGSFPRTAALTIDPAGAGVFSDLPDLLTFTHALLATDQLLRQRERVALERSVSTVTAHDLLLSQGFSIRGHGGASPGAQTIVAFDAAHGTTVATWCNRLDPGPSELLASVLAAQATFALAAGP